jgi:predicted N-acetyltransferase YhbS
MTAHTSEDGLVIVIGCLNDYRGEMIEQARQAIAEEYNADHAYFVALELAQRWYDPLEYTNTN